MLLGATATHSQYTDCDNLLLIRLAVDIRYQQISDAPNSWIMMDAIKDLHKVLEYIIGDCAAEEIEKSLHVLNLVPGNPQIMNGCAISYSLYPSNVNDSVIYSVLVGDQTIEKIKRGPMREVDGDLHLYDHESEEEFAGNTQYMVMYSAMEHQEVYNLRYEFYDQLWDVRIDFQMLESEEYTMAVISILC